MTLKMDANQVRAYINAKYPSAMKSPLAQQLAKVTANDEADRAIGFARLQAVATGAQTRRDAATHAEDCLDSCDGWEVESLGFNIENNFPSLDPDQCDDIAEAVMRKRGLL